MLVEPVPVQLCMAFENGNIVWALMPNIRKII
jgi:hypothetical protein